MSLPSGSYFFIGYTGEVVYWGNKQKDSFCSHSVSIADRHRYKSGEGIQSKLEICQLKDF